MIKQLFVILILCLLFPAPVKATDLPPRFIQIRGYVWEVHIEKPPPELCGHEPLDGCSLFYPYRDIYITPHPTSSVRETLWHEILHIAFNGHGSFDDKKPPKYTEEDFILKASPDLLDIIQTNPDLMDYLLERTPCPAKDQAAKLDLIQKKISSHRARRTVRTKNSGSALGQRR